MGRLGFRLVLMQQTRGGKKKRRSAGLSNLMQRSKFSNTLYKTEPPRERFGSPAQDGPSSEVVFILVFFLPEPP